MPIDSRRFVRYVGAGAVTFGVNLGLTTLLHEIFGVHPNIAVAVSLVVVWLANFFAARHYIFESVEQDASHQALRFAVAAAFMRVAEYVLFLFFFELLSLDYRVGLTAAMGSVFVLKYFVYGTFVFKKVEGEPG